MKMNHAKTKKTVSMAHGIVPCKDTEHVSSLRVLGIIINDKLMAADHVTTLLISCSSLFYSLQVLGTHGISAQSLHDIFRATVVAKILYCAPAWLEMRTANDHVRLNLLLYCARSTKLLYLPPTLVTIYSHYREMTDR